MIGGEGEWGRLVVRTIGMVGIPIPFFHHDHPPNLISFRSSLPFVYFMVSSVLLFLFRGFISSAVPVRGL